MRQTQKPGISRDALRSAFALACIVAIAVFAFVASVPIVPTLAIILALGLFAFAIAPARRRR